MFDKTIDFSYPIQYYFYVEFMFNFVLGEDRRSNMKKGNREYKSDVFSMLMEDKKNALQVYNALNNTNYADPEAVEMKTLNKGVSLSIRNDAAFVVDAALSIYEHQSTICPNMPVRNLIYYTNIIESELKNRNIYGYGLVKIPLPKFVVFYNGSDDQPETYEMKLSNAFEKQTDNPELELRCKVYNINRGKNRELLEKCSILKEYMIFVDYVRTFHAEQNFEDLKSAIEKAINTCIQESVLKDFLMQHRFEVEKVTELDYTFDRQLLLEREEARTEGRAEGRAEGLSEGRLSLILNMIDKKMSKEDIFNLGVTEEEYETALSK